MVKGGAVSRDEFVDGPERLQEYDTGTKPIGKLRGT